MAALLPAKEEYPENSIPTIFADGVPNLAPSQYVVKFYLTRVEPGISDLNNYRQVPAAQIIMPTLGFLQTVVFFEQQIQHLIKNGYITQEQLDDARKVVSR